MDFHHVRQTTSFIDNSIEAGIPLSGNLNGVSSCHCKQASFITPLMAEVLCVRNGRNWINGTLTVRVRASEWLDPAFTSANYAEGAVIPLQEMLRLDIWCRKWIAEIFVHLAHDFKRKMKRQLPCMVVLAVTGCCWWQLAPVQTRHGALESLEG